MDSGLTPPHNLKFTGWVRIPFTDVIRTTLISILIPEKMQLPEAVRDAILQVYCDTLIKYEFYACETINTGP